jgi:predicted DNA-binding transcriptional regulator AlpA
MSSPKKQLRPILRFSDLKQRKICNNWSTLRRLVDNCDFPRGFLLGPCQRAWYESDVAQWIENRPPYQEPTRLIGGARMRVAGEPLKRRKAGGGGR